ncbi:MAG: hypothetical protein ACE5I2_07435 [Anaerolineae bacterium]
MSYSRWDDKWPGGGDSWYIYHEADGGLVIYPPFPHRSLNKRDVERLRDILNEALETWDGLYAPTGLKVDKDG